MRAALVTIVFAGLTGVVHAADPVVAPAEPALPPYSFNGFYSGILAGYGTVDGRSRPTCVTGGITNGAGCPSAPGTSPRIDDFIAGSEFGYDLQLTPGSGFVVGAAGDFQSTRLRGYSARAGSFPAAGGGAFPFSVHHAGQRLDWLGTVRGKLGYAVDRFLVYGTGGLAFGNVRIDTTTTLSLLQYGDVQFDGRNGDWRTGYAVGGGIEYAFSERLSAKVETLRYDLGNRRVLAAGTDYYGGASGAGAYRAGTRIETSGTLARVGLNYRFGEELPFVGLLNDIRNVGTYAVRPPSTWDFESGMRYFYSSGTFSDVLGDPFVQGQRNSRLTYKGYGAHSAESFARLDHNPTGLFLKGFFGGGQVSSGRLFDEDFPPGIRPYSKTAHKIKDGDISYAAIDLGYTLARGDTYKLGAFLGYQYSSELINGFGCRQVAQGDVCAGRPPIPTNVKGLTENAHWNGMRIGLIGEVRHDRFKLSLEGAYLPVVGLTGFDRHWLRPDINPLPQSGTGDGYFFEGVVTYDVTSAMSVGIGGRYWNLDASKGRTQFPFVPSSPNTVESNRYGGFVQASYRISDMGFGGF